MKRKSREVPVLAKILFPETYEDAVDALLKYMPYLKMPALSGALAEKAIFITMLAMGRSDEPDWDLKEEQGESVSMCIFLSNESLSGPEREMDDEARRCANYSFIRKMVESHAKAFGSIPKRLPQHKQ